MHGNSLRALLILAISSCWLAPATAAQHASLGPIVALESPAAAHSGEPALAVAPDGGVWMSWIEKHDQRWVLRVARLAGDHWAAPRTVLESSAFFVNWADTPVLAALGGDRLALAWPWKHGGDGYAYDVQVAMSQDGGATWSPPVTVNRDGTATEHGFVALAPVGADVELVWLDGRKYATAKPKTSKPDAHGHGGLEAEGEMSVRSARVLASGALGREVEIDPRACDCCNTAAVAIPGGVLVAYRDRDAKETRDIAVTRLENGRWAAPATLHPDGWKTPACPVNGPALDAQNERVVAAWFAVDGDQPRVRTSFSLDGGRRFDPPIEVASSDPLGRVDVSLLADGSALVSWFEAQGQDAFLRVQRVAPSGAKDEPVTVASTSAARASGFPRMVTSGNRVVFAWTDTGNGTRVRTTSARLP